MCSYLNLMLQVCRISHKIATLSSSLCFDYPVALLWINNNRLRTYCGVNNCKSLSRHNLCNYLSFKQEHVIKTFTWVLIRNIFIKYCIAHVLKTDLLSLTLALCIFYIYPALHWPCVYSIFTQPYSGLVCILYLPSLTVALCIFYIYPALHWPCVYSIFTQPYTGLVYIPY